MSGEVAPTSALRGSWLRRVTALSLGLHPHTNVGPLSVPEMRGLQQCNTSMGLMLEQVTPALAVKGGVHRYAPSKRYMRLQCVCQMLGDSFAQYSVSAYQLTSVSV
jgi:7,8-didemethyl-8-hydroxy-5-deazariboflavin synthase